MNPSREKGDRVDNMDPHRKWGVIMRLTSMMDASDPLLRMEGITLCELEWSLLAKDGPADVTLTWRVPTFSCGYRRITFAQEWS